MLFRELIDDYPDKHMKPINTVCRKSAEFLILKQKVHRATTEVARDDSDAYTVTEKIDVTSYRIPNKTIPECRCQ
jgi:hypothetical protein